MTAQTAHYESLLGELVEALTAVGITVERHDGAMVIDGTRVVIAIVDRAHPTPAALAHLIAHAEPRRPAVVVADRISEPGRELLRRAGWGWFDRRGHLRLWASGVRVDLPVPAPPGGERLHSGNPWTTVGLEVALAALLDPEAVVSARRTATQIGRSVGAVHEAISRLGSVGLVGNASRLPLLPDLFWETAAHWPDDEWLELPADLGEVATRIGTERLVRVDERAATLGGARIAAAADLPPRAYVSDHRLLRRLRTMVDRNAVTRSLVRTAPVHFLPLNDHQPPDTDHPWSVAHPIVCALRLASDPARGREIVEDWGIVPGGPDE